MEKPGIGVMSTFAVPTRRPAPVGFGTGAFKFPDTTAQPVVKVSAQIKRRRCHEERMDKMENGSRINEP